MINLTKKLIAFILCVVTATASYQSVAAEGITGVFRGITDGANVSSTSMAVMQSQSRTYVTGGSASVRFGTKQVQLISVEPPRASAGCNGIDMHFGGFSFISGAEIQNMVKMIMKNAVGLVIDLAIKVLCPACADAMNSIRAMANLARAMAADSCVAAKAILGATMKAVGTGGNSLCKSVSWNSSASCDRQIPSDQEAKTTQSLPEGASKGWFDDMISGLSEAMKDGPGAAIRAAQDKMDQFNKQIADTAAWFDGTKDNHAMSVSNLNQLESRGNINDTMLLGLMGIKSYPQRLFLMSMTGTEMIELDNAESIKARGGANSDPYVRKGVNPTVEPEAAVCLLKWGAGGPPPGIEGKNDNCGDITRIQLLACDSAPKADKSGTWPDRTTLNNGKLEVGCMSMSQHPLKEWSTLMDQQKDASIDPDLLLNFSAGIVTTAPDSIQGYGDKVRKAGGFYGLVQNALLTAVKRTGQKSGQATAEEMQVINMISSISPIPVYKLINSAAAYPAEAAGLLDSYAEVIASALAEGYIRHLMYSFNDIAVTGAELSPEQQAQAEHLRQMLRIIDSSYTASAQRFLQQQMLYKDFNTKLDAMQNMVGRQIKLQGSGGSTRFSQVIAPQ